MPHLVFHTDVNEHDGPVLIAELVGHSVRDCRPAQAQILVEALIGALCTKHRITGLCLKHRAVIVCEILVGVLTTDRKSLKLILHSLRLAMP